MVVNSLLTFFCLSVEELIKLHNNLFYNILEHHYFLWLSKFLTQQLEVYYQQLAHVEK